MVSEPTRGENILDYFLTSNPTLVNDIEIHPGIADHDLVLINANVKPHEGKQIPRSVPLFKKQTGKVSRHTSNQAVIKS